MIIRPGVSPIWSEPFPDMAAALDPAFERAASGVRIFFRADDVAVPSAGFRRMVEIFRTHEVSLEMAVTPAWLRKDRALELMRLCPETQLFRFHQHGWRHVSHQVSGKKGEFGADRTEADKRKDLVRGAEKLSGLLGSRFERRFTPPWNRFDAVTAALLRELEYLCVSRSEGEERKVPLPQGLPDHFVNVDLHTRNESDSAQSRRALLAELVEALESGHCGVMLHHQRMNGAAFEFLDALLAALVRSGSKAVRFADMD